MNAKTSCVPDQNTLATFQDQNRTGATPSGADANETRWFVLQTHPQAERLAVRELAEKGYVGFLPMVSEKRQDRVLKSRWHIVTAPLFPGYLFVQGEVNSQVWRPVRYLPGVKRLFSTPDMRPIPVPRGQVEKFISETGARTIIRGLPDIENGSAIVLAEGPFADHEGICLWSDETRVRVLMQIFGRATEMTVARGALR